MKTILITGITSELLAPFVELVLKMEDLRVIGTFNKTVPAFRKENIELHQVDMNIESEIDNFLSTLKDRKIDYFLQGHGDCASNEHFENIKTEDIYSDIRINLISLIKILQTIVVNMKKNNFGRILLISTASASHGGGINTFAYGLSKLATEYLVKSLAKEYTKDNVLVNAIAPGFFNTKFHFQRANKTKYSFKERVKFVRIGRHGEPVELISMIKSLLIENSFISSEIVKIDGADFV